MKRIVLGLAFALNCSPLYAGKMVLMPELGRSTIGVDAGYTVSETSNHEVGVVASLVGGYKFDSHIILAANHSFTDSDDFFGAGDYYTLYEVGVVAGYSFDLATRFRVIPMVGLSYWELDSTEGRLFNSGPEERLENKGRDPYWRINFEFPSAHSSN